MLKISEVSKRFNNVKAIENISFSLPRKSIIGLAGPSGCGKSTLLRCIQGLEKVDTGTIEINGQSGFMFQDFQLFPHMNVLQNITFALNIKNSKKAENEKSALKLLKTLSLESFIKSYPRQLSGGQKQRVALARTLIMSPDIILCDEPTSGLDIGSTEDIIELLRKVKIMGMSMLIASHDIEFIKKLVDYVYILKNGEIIAKLYPKDIRSAAEYMQLFI